MAGLAGAWSAGDGAFRGAALRHDLPANQVVDAAVRSRKAVLDADNVLLLESDGNTENLLLVSLHGCLCGWKHCWACWCVRRLPATTRRLALVHLCSGCQATLPFRMVEVGVFKGNLTQHVWHRAARRPGSVETREHHRASRPAPLHQIDRAGAFELHLVDHWGAADRPMGVASQVNRCGLCFLSCASLSLSLSPLAPREVTKRRRKSKRASARASFSDVRLSAR